MNKEAWLQLSEYSNKYRVSVSTLRRRIKAGDIQYQFEDGKYWLPDRAIEKYARNRPTAASASIPQVTIPDPMPEPVMEEVVLFNEGPEFPVSTETEIPLASDSSSFVTRDEVLEITNNMISELKSAYVLVLQEKEAQIMEAKKEIADLKTLCHTLESENEKIKAEASAPLSGWFLDEDSEVEL